MANDQTKRHVHGAPAGHNHDGMEMRHDAHMVHEKGDVNRNEHMNHNEMNMHTNGHVGPDHSVNEVSMMQSKHHHHEMDTMTGHDMADMTHDMHDMDHMNMEMSDDMMMHGGHMMHMGNMKLKLIVSLILTVPIILLSPMMGMKLPITISGIPGQEWIVLALGSVLFFYGGTPFFAGALGELRSRQPAMMSLITLGISVAYFYSVYATLTAIVTPNSQVMDFFWELATLIDIMLIGHIIEMNAVMKAGSATSALADLLPKQAHLTAPDGTVADVPVSSLQIGDTVLVKENERVPADGQLMSPATLDESLLTGESKLVMREAGEKIIGGSMNGNQAFQMKVDKGAGQGFLANVQELVMKAQMNKSASETMADKVAGWLFYAAVFVGILALIIWTTVAGFPFALPVAVTVFIIACPHALGLAVPLVVARLTGLSAARGVLIQNRQALETVNNLRYVLMDKTGTLTDGQFKLRAIVPAAGVDQDELLKVAAGLEVGSTHPLATGVLAAAADANLAPAVVTDMTNVPGEGVYGSYNGRRVAIVRASTVDDAPTIAEYVDKGYTVSAVLIDERYAGLIALGDAIKPDAVGFIKYLQDNRLVPVMLTGDNMNAAQVVANQLGINDIHADMRPADKIAVVQDYQKRGAVLMLGDGVNDSPALAQADIGVAIGAGTDVAINAADVVLVKSRPSDVQALLEIATAARRKMTENLWWGAGYNLIAIPLAAGVLIPVGFKLDPMFGAVLMSLSTVIVALNALTLRIKAVA